MTLPSIPVRTIRPGLVLTIGLTAQFMAMLDTNIVNVAAATIRADLHTGGAALQLVLAGYTVAYAVLLITGARTGSLIGYRQAFLLGLLAFTVASAACGLAQSTWELIAFRFAQGIGAALCIPQVFSLIQRHFTGTARARALGVYAAVISVGVLAGQILGGVLVSANLWGLQWRPIFLINVPVGLVLLAFGRRLLPADEPAGLVRRGLDLPGLVLLTGSVLTFVVPLLFGYWWLLAVSITLVCGFVAVQRRARTPLMPARLFRAPGLLPALAALVAMMVSYGGYMLTVALQLQTGLGYSPLRAGLSFLPNAVAFGVTGMLWQRLPARWLRRESLPSAHGHGPMVPLGLTVGALSTVVLAIEFADPVAFLAIQLVSGVGSALAFSPLMTRALARVEPADAADASGLLTTNVQLAQVLGIATIGSLYLASGITLALLGCASATAVAAAVSAVPGGRSRR